MRVRHGLWLVTVGAEKAAEIVHHGASGRSH